MGALATFVDTIIGRRRAAPTAVAASALELKDWSGAGWSTGDGFIPSTWGCFLNFWQMGHDPLGNPSSAVVEACVSAYSQTIAMCHGDHTRDLQNGGTQKVTTSALARILRKPNSYQTISDFMLNLVRSLLLEGNAYAVAIRNDRFEVAELHLMPPRSCRPTVDPETGAVFYSIGGNPFLDQYRIDGRETFIFPARDVLHVRLNTPRHPLIGETPLMAAALSLAASGAMHTNLASFFSNMSRPSGVLSTDNILTADQVKELRVRWADQSKGLNTGGVPILTAGLKWQSLSMTAQDAQLIEALKWTAVDVSRVFRIPLVLINDMTGATWNNAESLMQFWLASGLGFVLNHVELAFDSFFGLAPNDFTVFDTDALLRSAFAQRIEGLVKGVQGGIFAPNEARAREGLPAVEFGGEPRVQQQVVPLSFASQAPVPPAAPAAPAAPPAPANDDQDDPPDEAAEAAERAAIVAELKALKGEAMRRVA